MSTAPDPVGLVCSFLDGIRPHAERIPDPFSDKSASPGQEGRAVPVRVRGIVAHLAEQDRDITRRFAGERGTLLQQMISARLSNTTVYHSRLSGSYRTE